MYLVYFCCTCGGPVLTNAISACTLVRTLVYVLWSATFLKWWFLIFSAKIQPCWAFFVSYFDIYRQNHSRTSRKRRAPLASRRCWPHGLTVWCVFVCFLTAKEMIVIRPSAYSYQVPGYVPSSKRSSSLDVKTAERLWFFAFLVKCQALEYPRFLPSVGVDRFFCFVWLFFYLAHSELSLAHYFSHFWTIWAFFFFT